MMQRSFCIRLVLVILLVTWVLAFGKMWEIMSR